MYASLMAHNHRRVGVYLQHIPCECGCGQCFSMYNMVMKVTSEPSHPREYVKKSHAIEAYGDLRSVRQAGFR